MLPLFCVRINPLGRAVSWFGHPVREPGAIYGCFNGLEPEVGLTGTRRVRPVEPLSPGYVRRRTAIVGGRRHLGLEPTHPAGRRSLGINAKPSDHLPHHRIERRTVRVIHIIISGQSPEDRLSQKPDHGMQTVVDGSRISERTAGNIVQS